MSRKIAPFIAGVALLLLATAVFILLRPRPAKRIAARPPAVTQLEGSATPDLGAASLPIADVSAYAELHTSRTTVRDDVRIVEGLVQNYLQSLKTPAAPPLGFNEEITRALTGRNPLELAFIPSTHPAINARGLLCDRWGTPYHFHPIAHDRIDVRSAGADRKLFTPDDVVSASSPAVSGPVAEPVP